jgi:hypothetical protein
MTMGSTLFKESTTSSFLLLFIFFEVIYYEGGSKVRYGSRHVANSVIDAQSPKGTRG